MRRCFVNCNADDRDLFIVYFACILSEWGWWREEEIQLLINALTEHQ